jgi:hypothetical protein
MIAFYVRIMLCETTTYLTQIDGLLTRYSVQPWIVESRQIEISRLNFLMMAMERKNIRAESSQVG